MRFEFEIPDEVVDLLELSDGRTAEEILDAHLAEWVFGKTHHEAVLVKRGKHRKIPQTARNVAVAETVHGIMHADQFVPKADKKKAERIAALRQEVKKMPRDPFSDTPAKIEKKVLAKEKQAGLGKDENGTPRAGQVLRDQRKAAEDKIREDYKKARKPFEDMQAEIDAFEKGLVDAFKDHVEKTRYKPKVKRVKDGVGVNDPA